MRAERRCGARSAMQHLGSAVLDVLLGEYIQNLDQRQLELDVLNGHLLLQNLTIKGSALQRLQLPVLVKAGVIGRVELRIPWSKLATEPTKLKLDQLLLLIGPQSEAEWDQAAEAKREAQRKAAVLLAHEAKHRSVDADQRPATQKSSFAARLSARVLDRLQACMRMPSTGPCSRPGVRCCASPPCSPGVRYCVCAGGHHQRGRPIRRQLTRPVHILDHARDPVHRPALRRAAARGGCGTGGGWHPG